MTKSPACGDSLALPNAVIRKSLEDIGTLTLAAEILAEQTPVLSGEGAPPIFGLLERANVELRTLRNALTD